MRTAIVSDLHLGSAFGEDVARDAAVRRAAARGDRGGRSPRPARRRRSSCANCRSAAALEAARPFFEELGRGDGRPPRRARPRQPRPPPRRAAARRARARRRADLGARAPRAAAGGRGETDRRLARRGRALDIAYPGVWLRDDVYATHGHYMDCHMSLPRLECIAAAVVMRAFGRLPDPADARRLRAGPAPDLRLLLRPRPVRRSAPAARPAPPSAPGARSPAATAAAAGSGAPLRSAAIGAGVPAAVWAHQPPPARRLRARPLRGGDLRAAASTPPTELARRLGIDAAPRDHRPHPPRRARRRARPSGRCPAAASLHNTGSWVFASAFHHPGTPPGPYWPGTVTWVEDDGPPRRVRLLSERSRDELAGDASAAAAQSASHSAMIAADLRAGVLLEEVARRSRSRRGAGKLSSLGDPFADREGQDRVGVGPEDQGRALVLAQRVGDPFALGGAGRVGLGRQDQREGAGARPSTPGSG